MFIYADSKSTLVNTDHIMRIDLEGPCFERTYYMVVASLNYGTVVMYRGNNDGCDKYLRDFYDKCNHNDR